jgi:hypothetical protein
MTDLVYWPSFFLLGSEEATTLQFVVWFLMISLLFGMVGGFEALVKKAPVSIKRRSRKGR